jgi:EmrB/QacA subfamily drug resistance transporter
MFRNAQVSIYERRWWTLGALCVALLVLSVDNTILNVAIPTIERDLDASAGQMQWIVDSYLLVFAGLLLTMGAIGDRFGRRRALFAGLGIFGASSALSAFATTAEMLIVTRGLMGIGGALIMPATLSIITNVFPKEERGKAFGIWAGVFGIGIAIGPTGGGFLIEHFDWGAVFLVNIPIVVAALAMGARLIPESRDPGTPPIDVKGAVLSMVGLTALVYAIIDAPEAGWTAPSTLGVLALAVASLAAFVAWELRAKHPMVDMALFRDARFSAASIALALASFSLFGSIYLLTMHLQGVLGFSALEAGVRILPVAGGMVLAAPLSAAVAARFGNRATIGLGMTGVGVGLGLMLLADQAAGYGPVALSLTVLAIGMGLAMAPATESVMSSLPEAKAGVGSAMNDTARMVGGALGVAILGSVLSTGYRDGMDGASHAAQESLGGAATVAQQTGDPGLLHAAQDAFVSGMHTSVVVAAAVALAGAVLAVAFLPRRDRTATTRPATAMPEPAAA